MLENLKNSNKTVGLKQSIKVLESGMVRQVFVARDADEHIVDKIKELCYKSSIPIIDVDTMKLLGKACGIDVGTAVACILK